MDFRCFYPCELILSHIPVPARGKDKKQRTASSMAARWLYVDSLRHSTVKMTLPCRIFPILKEGVYICEQVK